MSAAPTWYAATANPKPAALPLQGRHDVRVAIVGGGFAGLNTALGLAERGVHDVMLLEAEDIGFGASGRNGGFVFAGYSLGEQALLKRLAVSVPGRCLAAPLTRSIPFASASATTRLIALRSMAA